MSDVDYDPKKRSLTLKHRGLDMAEAGLIFDGSTLTVEDDRKDCGEERLITIGTLRGRMIVVVWTWRKSLRRIISMRKVNEREQKIYADRLE